MSCEGSDVLTDICQLSKYNSVTVTLTIHNLINATSLEQGFRSSIIWIETLCTLLLTFQVNSSSISEIAGLAPGDLLVAVNGEDVQTYRHKVSSSVRITLLTL